MSELSISYQDKNCGKKIKKTILNLLKDNDNVVIICVGTDRSTGDSLGPLVGTLIKEKVKVPVFGTLDKTVNAKNIAETIDYVNKEYNNPFIIAIDACLGSTIERVGCIDIDNSTLKPGLALNKNLPEVGDISILGIVNISTTFDFLILQNTRLNTVYELSKQISNSLIKIFKNFNKKDEENKEDKVVNL